MTLLSDYTAGTVSSSGLVITGTGTAWKTAQFREGDEFIAGGWRMLVQSVDSETQITLRANSGVQGSALSGAPYRLRYMSDGSRASAQARQLIDMLSGTGTLEGLAGLTTAADKMPYFTGPGGAAALADLTAFGRRLVGAADLAAARGILGTREALTATRTLYVRTDGNNNNDGLTNTSGGAFATLQRAFDVVNATDLRHYNVIIKLGNTGNFAGGTLNGPFLGSGTVVVEGDTGTPANTTVTSAIQVNNAARLTVRYFRTQATIVASFGGVVTVGAGMNFGTVSGAHMHALTGGIIQAGYGTVNYTISGNAAQHIQMDAGSKISLRAGTITLTGTPAWGFAFVVMTSLSALYMDAITFVGAATGTRYYVAHNSVCLTGGGGSSYFPGSGGGSTPNGGLYL